MRLTVAARIVLLGLMALGATACGSSPSGGEKVVLGGTAITGTLDRPWGQVSAAPLPVKAGEPVAADLAFARDMIHHHRQAIELSDNLLSHEGVDERIKAAATFIRQDQTSEISHMTAWQEAWSASGVRLPDDPGHDPLTMPGMVSQDRVDRIAALDSAAAQIEFFVVMLEHHRGALEMSHDYLVPATNDFTINTAKHILREQQLEITYMERVIADLCAKNQVSTCPAS